MYSIPGYFSIYILGVICFQSLSCVLRSVHCDFQSVCQIQWHAALQHDLTAGKPLLISHAVAKSRLQFHETLAGFPLACFWAHFWLRAKTNEWKHRKWKQIQKYCKKTFLLLRQVKKLVYQQRVNATAVDKNRRCVMADEETSWLNARDKHNCHIRWEAEIKSLFLP